jgi:urease accessory protein
MKARQPLIAAFTSTPLFALAHAGDAEHAHSFAAGFAHPFSGWDHWLSFALIGLLAWRVARARVNDRVGMRSHEGWTAAGVAALFIAALMGGFYAAQRFIGLPYAQFAIAGLLIAIGFVLVLMMKPSFTVGALIAVLIGYVHGYVHGIELAGAWPAAMGMLAASALLAACGAMAGAALQRMPTASRRLQQVLGVMAAMLGVSLLAR